VQVGQFLAFDLEVSFAATDSSTQQQQQQQLELQVTLFALDAAAASAISSSSNGVQSSGTPTAAAAAGSSYAAMLLSGQSLGPRGFAAALGSGAGTPKAADAAHKHGSLGSAAAAAAAGGASSTDSLVDPGVLLTGCYNKLQVSVTPGGKHTARLHALLVQPGLYVFGVADVQLVQQQQQPDPCALAAAAAAAAAAAGGARAAAGSGGAKTAADSGAPGRIYYNQDRLYVLVTR
jgi:hypothetical protein